MSKQKAPPKVVPVSGEKKQLRGPLSPTAPDVTLYASIVNGQLASTTVLPPRPKATSILVTDDQRFAKVLSHTHLIMVSDEDPQKAMSAAYWAARSLALDQRTVSVAGSPSLLKAALDDSFRIVASCADGAEMPSAIGHWKSSRTKGSDIVTLSRD